MNERLFEDDRRDPVESRSATIGDRGARRSIPGLAVVLMIVLAGCGGGKNGGGAGGGATTPDFSAASFSASTTIDNPHFGLVPETVALFLESGPDGSAVEVVEVLDETRTIMGVACRAVRSQTFEDEELVEEGTEWYAQDDAGNVWCMGEEEHEFEYDEDGNLLAATQVLHWEAGSDLMSRGMNALPGHAMSGNPAIGDVFHVGFYPGIMEDTIEIVAMDAPVTLADGSFHLCLRTRESSTLSPGEVDAKFYATSVGLVAEESSDGSTSLERVGAFDLSDSAIPDFSAAVFSDPTNLDNPFFAPAHDSSDLYFVRNEEGNETIVVERMPGTKIVMGIPCAIIRDRVFSDGLLVEDTLDWYAQDDAGNVWYMGEAVINYEYDEDGNVIGTDTDGSFEAGLDIAGTGSIAEPGFQIPANPQVGMNYRQEYYEDEAEDVGLVVATGVTVTLADGRVFTGCLQTLDWNPLDGGGLEYKFHAPGFGLVVERALHIDEVSEHVGRMLTSPALVPDFAAATFGNPTAVTASLLPFMVGSTWEYESTTEDGIETIDVEVMPTTRVVAGVTCIVVRDQVFLDGVIIEDTFDWFAQDDSGAVWYLGEDVTNYEYDENGVLLGTNADGSWEAGLDVAGVGSIAQPGYVMPASVVPGTSHRQEYYPGEAEDMAFVVAIGVTVVLEDGTSYSDCLQTLDWNPLEPSALEYKFYAPGVGLVKEENLSDDELVELQFFSL